MTEADRIRKALWDLVDDQETPRTVKLDALDRLIQMSNRDQKPAGKHDSLLETARKRSAS